MLIDLILSNRDSLIEYRSEVFPKLTSGTLNIADLQNLDTACYELRDKIRTRADLMIVSLTSTCHKIKMNDQTQDIW